MRGVWGTGREEGRGAHPCHVSPDPWVRFGSPPPPTFSRMPWVLVPLSSHLCNARPLSGDARDLYPGKFSSACSLLLLAPDPKSTLGGLIPTVLGFSFPVMRFTPLFQEVTSVSHYLDYW